MTDAPMTTEEVSITAAALAAHFTTGVTSTGPTTKRHRGSGAFLRAVEPLSTGDVVFARTWALGSGMAATLPDGAADELPARVPIVLPEGEVTRAEPGGLNANALLAAQMTAAAEVAVLLGLVHKRVRRLAALERLREAVAHAEAPDGSSAA